MATLRRKFTFDAPSARYRDKSTGRYLRPASIRKSVDQVIVKAQKELRSISERLKGGSVDLPQWQTAMAENLLEVHGATAAVAKGGFQAMGADDWQDVKTKVKRQAKFLVGFAKDIRSGEQPLDGTFDNRVSLYGDAARGTFEDVQREEKQEAGATLERRILGPEGTQHCAECEAAAAQGWQPIGTLPAIGETPCGPRCACRFEYKSEEAGFAYDPSEKRDEHGRWIAGAQLVTRIKDFLDHRLERSFDDVKQIAGLCTLNPPLARLKVMIYLTHQGQVGRIGAWTQPALSLWRVLREPVARLRRSWRSPQVASLRRPSAAKDSRPLCRES